MGEKAIIDDTPLLLRLPSELLSEIIISLSVPDRFVFRATCRAIMNHFQVYPFCMWYRLHLKDEMISRFLSMMAENRARRRIIRKYARHISFNFTLGLYTIPTMNALINGLWHRIESIDMVNPTGCVQQFMQLIRDQCDCLKSIRMSKGDILSSGYFGEIFSTCTELEVFHYIGGRGANRVNPEADDLIITQPFRLTSLHLDFEFDVEIVFISEILQHCPKLVDLELISDSDHDDRQLLKIIHTHCPNLTNFKYLRRRDVVRQGKRNQVQFSGSDINFRVCPRIYMTEEDLFLTPWIPKYHMTIENLNASMCLLKPHKESLQQLASVQYPQLRVLDLHCICDDHDRQYSSTHLSAFLEACPALEELYLLGLDSINDTVLKSIGKLTQLYRLALELNDGSMVTPQGIRWLLATTTSLEILNFGGNSPYFTNQHLYAVAQYKRLAEFSVASCASQLTTFGVHKFVNLIRDTRIEYLLLGRLHDLNDQTILAFAQLQALKYLEIGVFTRSTQSRVVYELFEARTSDHTLTVKYLNGHSPESMSSAVDYY